MANTDDPRDWEKDYSTLEAASRSQPPYSTLEAAYRNAEESADGKQVFSLPQPYPNDADAENRAARGFWSKRLCGMRMKVAVMLGVVILLLVIGGALGGALGSRKKSNAAPTDASSTPPSTANVTDLFGPDKWHALSTNDGEDYFIQALYDISALVGRINATITTSSSPSTIKQWQFRPVSHTWENSTYLPSGWTERTRLYWVSCQQFGPDVALTLNEQSFKEIGTGNGGTIVNLETRVESDERQLWFFELVDGTAEPRYRVYNRFSEVEFTLMYKATWEHPLLAKGLVAQEGAKGDWEIVARGEIDRKDGGFTWVVDASL